MKILASILLAISILTDAPNCQQANISVLIKDAETGKVIDSYRPDNVVPPASVQKLLTTGAALEMLGPSFRFTTTLEYTGYIENGVLRMRYLFKSRSVPLDSISHVTLKDDVYSVYDRNGTLRGTINGKLTGIGSILNELDRKGIPIG